MKNMMWVLLAVLSFGATGCIESPLFSHADASTLRDRDGLKKVERACPLSFDAQKLCASVTWTALPTNDEDAGEAVIRFWSRDEGTEAGPYVDPGFVVGVKLWMPSMGHGSSPVKVSSALDSQQKPIAGVFEAKEIHFIMGGEWEVWVQLKQDKKVIGQAKIDVEI